MSAILSVEEPTRLPEGDLRVTVKLQNNRLYQAIHARSDSVQEFCRLNKLLAEDVEGLLDLTVSPYDEGTKHYNAVAKHIANICEMKVRELFPHAIYADRYFRKAEFAFVVSSADLNLRFSEPSGGLGQILSQSLSPTEQLEQRDENVERWTIAAIALQFLNAEKRALIEGTLARMDPDNRLVMQDAPERSEEEELRLNDAIESFATLMNYVARSRQSRNLSRRSLLRAAVVA